MKVELNKDNRIKREENYEALNVINKEIRVRMNPIEAEYAEERKVLREENDTLYELEKEFRDEVRKVLGEVDLNITQLKVESQVGKGSLIINEYVGTISKIYGHVSSTTIFDFTSPDRNDGRPFSIGLSCLKSIEIL